MVATMALTWCWLGTGEQRGAVCCTRQRHKTLVQRSVGGLPGGWYQRMPLWLPPVGAGALDRLPGLAQTGAGACIDIGLPARPGSLGSVAVQGGCYTDSGKSSLLCMRRQGKCVRGAHWHGIRRCGVLPAMRD